MLITRFNILKIASDHIKTFHPGWGNEVNWWEVALYFVSPIIIIGLLYWVGLFQKIKEFNGLVEAFSIFTGFLFSFVVLLQQQYQTFQKNNDDDRMQLARETYSNALFCILIAIATIAFLLLNTAVAEETSPDWIVCLSLCLRFAIMYLALLFLITLLMVIKRLYMLFDPIHNRPEM